MPAGIFRRYFSRSRQFLLTQKRLREGGLPPGGQSALPRTLRVRGCLSRSRQFLLSQKRLREGGLPPGGQSALPRTLRVFGV